MKTFSFLRGEDVKYNLINLRQIVFEVTEACNLNCRYCGLADLYKGNENRGFHTLSFEKARLLIDHMATLWKDNHSQGSILPVAIGFYGGEPLLNISLIKEVVTYIGQLQNTGKHFHYVMTTNAMLLDKYMDYLVQIEMNLLISLDGDETAQSYRTDHAGNNSFDRVFRNIKLLQEKYPNYFERFVRFNSVLHNRNNIDTIHHFIMCHFKKKPTIALLNNAGIKPEKIKEFRNMYQNKMDSMMRSGNCEAIESELFMMTPRVYSLARYLYSYSGNTYPDMNSLILDLSDCDIPPTGTCFPFSKKMFVTADGNILQCERIDHDFVLGCIHDDHVELDCQVIANHHNSYVSKCIEQCMVCASTEQCPTCVYYIDNIREEKPQCKNFCNRESINKQTKQTMDFLREHPGYYERILKEVVLKS
jgi:uncharacterized protein